MSYIEKLRQAKDIAELKTMYKKLMMQYHPDRNGSVEITQEINNEYEKLFKILKNKSKEEVKEVPKHFIDLIDNLMKMNGAIIDVVGTWVWLSGDTYEHKEEIKTLGFKWSRVKKKWYLSPTPTKRKRGTGKSYEQITSEYGLQRFKSKGMKAIG